MNFAPAWQVDQAHFTGNGLESEQRNGRENKRAEQIDEAHTGTQFLQALARGAKHLLNFH